MWKTLAKLLGVPERAAEDALKSEKLAREVLTRRQALNGLAALATGTAFSFGVPVDAADVIITGVGGFEVGDSIYIDTETVLPGVGKVRPAGASWTITGISAKGELSLAFNMPSGDETVKWLLDLRSSDG